MDFKIYFGSEVVPAYEIYDGVKAGVLDMGMSGFGNVADVVLRKADLFGASGFPAGPICEEMLAWYYDGDGEKLLQELLDLYDYNLVVIAMNTPTPAELFCHSNVKLETAADLKGIKFRTKGAWAKVLESYGASVMTVPGAEIYPAMERGVIDAFEYCGPAIDWTMGFHEMTKYIGVPGIHSPEAIDPTVVNRQAWEELPEELQLLLKEALMAFCYNYYSFITYQDAIAMGYYADYGTEVFTVSDELQQDIAKRTKELVAEYCEEDPLYKEIFANQAEYIKMFRLQTALVQPKRYSIFD